MTLRRIFPALAVSGAFALVCGLNLAGARALYLSLLAAWGMRPFRFPFLDADTVMSALRCRRLGVDVFATNPCDALGRVYDYSPLWLHLSVLPFAESWIVPVGLGIVASFILSLLLLPPGRDWWCTAAITLGALSTAVVFALERANNDVIIFVLATVAAALAVRSFALRCVGYGALMLAGLLKYYPLLTMAIALRERAGRFLAVAACSVGILMAFVLLDYDSLRRALALIPVGSYFDDMFGARTLPVGLAVVLGWPLALGRIGEVGLDLLCIALAWWLSSQRRIFGDLQHLDDAERSFLLVGALLILGCFVTAQNIGYRALHLILVLPALTALARTGHRAWRAIAVVVVVLLWAEGWRHWVDGLVMGTPPWAMQPFLDDAPDNPIILATWLSREALWWVTVTMLLATVFASLRDTEILRWLRGASSEKRAAV